MIWVFHCVRHCRCDRRFCRTKSTSAASRKHLKGASLVPSPQIHKVAHAAILWKWHREGRWVQVVGVLSREGSGAGGGVIRQENKGRKRRASEQRRRHHGSQPRDKEDRGGGGGLGSWHTMLRSSCTNTPVNGYHLQGVRRHPPLPVYVYAVMLRVTPGFCCLGYPAKKNTNLCKFLMCQKKVSTEEENCITFLEIYSEWEIFQSRTSGFLWIMLAYITDS